MTKLRDLATTIRSKNAGVDHITFDVIFRDEVAFRRTIAAGVLSPTTMADLFGVDPARIERFVVFAPAHAIKFTIRRRQPAGSPGEPDPFGSQSYPPLFDVEVP